jgi:hypothetical protein
VEWLASALGVDRLPRTWAWLIIGLSTLIATLVLGFVFSGLRNLAALVVLPVLAVMAYEARRMSWVWWEIALLAAVVVTGAVLFLMSPTYLGRLL